MLSTITTKIKFALLLAAALLLIVGTVRYVNGRNAVKENAALKADIAAGNLGNAISNDIGINLNAGQGQYETDAYQLDQQIPSAGPTFDADSMRRINERISAGERARERAAQMSEPPARASR